MKTKIVSCKWPHWTGIKLLPLWLALFLMAWQNTAVAEYKLLHAFAGGANDGNDPIWESSLLASGSTFYGMTALGGDTNTGVLFHINMTGTGIHVVHSFDGFSILNQSGSKNDGAYAVGTPLLVGSTLYGMTQQGGSNDLGTVFSVNTDGSGFQVLHHFGGLNDGYTPYGSLILSGTNLFGLTEAGGTNGISQGIVFSIGTNGGGYQILHSFIGDGEGPQGSLALAGSTLFGMTGSTIFQINTDGSGYELRHIFAGTPGDGDLGFGSLVVSGPMLYGMTFNGGANNLGCVFQFNTTDNQIHLLHSFAETEAYEPYGDLALSGSTLYGITHNGVTNYPRIGLIGSGSVFQINTDGNGYQVIHTFLFPLNAMDGSLPFGSPLVVGSELYGMASLGGSTLHDKGCIFALSLTGSPGPPAPTLAITSPKEKAIVTEAPLTVTGTTHDNVAVTNVAVELNDVALTVVSSNNFANWTAVTNLSPGTNTILAYAVNTNGETSSNSVTLFYKLPAELTATFTGRGSLSPNDNGKELNINENYTIKAMADTAAGFGFTNWTVANAGYTSALTSDELTFQMVSNLQLTANFVDIEPPTVTITTKAATGSNSVVVISGTAKDNVGVVSVWCQVGSNGEWTLASTSNGYTNWTVVGILSMGTNTIRAYAEDAAGNQSLITAASSVKLDDDSAWFTPETLAGTMLQLVDTSNESAVLSFEGSSFSQVGSDGTNTGVGVYTYTPQTTANTGLLATTFTAPPTTVASNGGDGITLTFTSDTNGTFTDTNGSSGTFTLSVASNTAPASLSGLTVQGADTNSGYQFTNENGDGTFTITDNSGSSSGAYTYAQYSPMAGMLQEILTNGADLGTTNYVLLSFLTDSNTYYVESDTANSTNTSAGTFSYTGETSMAGYTAPVSVAGLTGALTFISTNGHRVTFMVSYGPTTYGQFTTDANVSSSVGTYTYTRTGPKTALYLNTSLSPPEEVGDDILSSDYFTKNNSANFTNSGGHGTITFSTPAVTVPLSLVGRKLVGTKGGFSFGDGTFSGVGHNSGEGGAYTYAIYGPQAAMAILTFTGNTTEYLELWFSSATVGNYRQDDGSGNIKTGTFTLE